MSKHKKSYHALTADPSNKWAYSWSETVDIADEVAVQENEKFEDTGIKYEKIEEAVEAGNSTDDQSPLIGSSPSTEGGSLVPDGELQQTETNSSPSTEGADSDDTADKSEG